MTSKKTSLVEVIRRARQVYREAGDKNLAIEAIREMRKEVGLNGAKNFFDWIDGTNVDATKLSDSWCEEHWHPAADCWPHGLQEDEGDELLPEYSVYNGSTRDDQECSNCRTELDSKSDGRHDPTPEIIGELTPEQTVVQEKRRIQEAERQSRVVEIIGEVIRACSRHSEFVKWVDCMTEQFGHGTQWPLAETQESAQRYIAELKESRR
jgi:hypothetical protein